MQTESARSRRAMLFAVVIFAALMMVCSFAIPYVLCWTGQIVYALPGVVGSFDRPKVCAAGVPHGEFSRVISVLRAQGIACEGGSSTRGPAPIMVHESERENAQILLIEDASKHKYRLDLVRGNS